MYEHAGIRLSPHVSWSAPGALETALERFAVNLQRHLAGEPLQGVVDPVEGY
jgi:phosphoglycerate dehydrogenase-like enzyme